jgi:hypothetical protein
MIGLLLEVTRAGSIHGVPAMSPVAPKTEHKMTKQKKATGKGTTQKSTAPAAKTASPTTKLARMQALLSRPEGATLPQLVKALDWQAHSIRGAISGSLKKKQGLEIVTSKAEGQDRVYRIAN